LASTSTTISTMPHAAIMAIRKDFMEVSGSGYTGPL
jgi:hypothetical protein